MIVGEASILVRPITAGFGKQLLADTDKELAGSGATAGQRFGKAFVVGLAGVGIATAAIGVAAVKMGSDYQRSLLMIHTQAGATAENLGQITKQIFAMAPAVGFGPKALVEALYHVESVGYRGAAAMDILRIAAEGAKIGHEDLEKTTNSLVATMASGITGFHGAAQAMGVLDAIIGAGNMRMDGLNAAIGTGFLATAQTFHISLQSVGAALAFMTDRGSGAQESATRLRMSIALMAAPSNQASKVLGALGLSSSEVHARTTAMSEALSKAHITTSMLATDLEKPDGFKVALEHLKTALTNSGVSATTASAIISRAFGGGRSGATIMAMYANLDVLGKKFDQISGTSNNFGKSWAATQQTASFQFSRFTALVETGLTRLGLFLLPQVTRATKGVVDGIIAAGPLISRAWDSIMGGFQNPGAKIGPSVSPFAAIFLTAGQDIRRFSDQMLPALRSAGSALMGALGPTWDLIRNLARDLAPLGGLLLTVFGGAVIVGVRLFAAAIRDGVTPLIRFLGMLAGNTAFQAFAVGVGVLLVPLGAFLIVLKAMEVAQKAWTIATDIAKAAAISFRFAMWLLNAAMDANPIGVVVLALSAIAAGLIYAYNHSKTFRDIVQGALRAVGDAAAATGRFFTRMWHDIVGAFDTVWPVIKRWGPLLLAVFMPFLGLPLLIVQHWGQITGFFTRLWNDVKAVFTSAMRFITGVLDAIGGFFSRHWRLLLTIATAGLGLIYIVIQDHWKAISGFFVRIWHDVAGFMSRMWHDVAGFFTAGARSTSDTTSGIWRTVTGFFSRIWHDVTGWVSRMWNDIVGFFTRGANWVWNNILRPFWDRQVRGFTNLWRDITGWVSRLWNDVTGFFTRGANWVFDNILRPFWDRLYNGFMNIWHSVTGFVSNLWHDVTGFFSRMRGDVVGIFDDMATKIGHAWDRVRDLVAAPIRWVVETVYNKGIAPLWNDIAGVLHENTHLNPLHFARGGTIPGNHDRDDVMFLGTPGEVVVPKPVVGKFGGPQALMAALGFDGKGGPGHYADGGILGSLGHLASDGLHGAPDLASRIGHDIIHPTDLLGDIKNLAMGALSAVAVPIVHHLESLADNALRPMGGAGDLLDKGVHVIGDDFIRWVQNRDAADNAAMGFGSASSNDIITYAESFVGKVPYVWGGTNPSGWDCSGFTSWVYNHFGIGAPRTSEEQQGWARPAPETPGGLVFFGRPADHVGIALGGGKMVNAEHPGSLTMNDNIWPNVSGFGLPPQGLGAAGALHGSGSLNEAVFQALAINGLPSSLAGRVLAQIQTESGGNPNAVQGIVDVNSGAGGANLARGAMQVIPSTFAAYHVPGTSNNIFDLLANVAAGINYDRHKGGGNPGLSDLGQGHGYAKGGVLYDRGGDLPSGGVGINLSGRRERVLDPDETEVYHRQGSKVGTTVHQNNHFNGVDLPTAQAQSARELTLALSGAAG